MDERNIRYTWNLFKLLFPILDDKNLWHTTTHIENEQFNEMRDHVVNWNLSKTINDVIINKIEQRLREDVAPKFWKYFDKQDTANNGFMQFYNAVECLYDYFQKLSLTVNQLIIFRQTFGIDDPVYNRKDLHSSLVLMLKSTLLSQLHSDYQEFIKQFYEIALELVENDNNEDSVQEICSACNRNRTTCSCLNLFYETNRKLGEMNLFVPLAGQTLTNLIYSHISNHIQKVSKDNFDSSYISSLEKWLETVIVSWLENIYKYDSSNSSTDNEMLHKKLKNYLYNSYTKIRIDQLFNIIIEYPESLPALEDLRNCLPRTDLGSYLVQKLQKAMETRLLHPGVSTPDVLTAYIAAIRSLRVLDPSGLLLETVTQPVHQYLRSREDTVRCVVSSLTEEGPNDLAEELIRGDAVQIDENSPIDEEDENWNTWTPDPVEANPTKTVPSKRTSDIISMLVNVYGSKELFVNEYRTLLADRLLSHYSCDTEKEIRYLELLKLRFGDSQLHYCEVMLKDIADSKRINQHIKQDPEYTESEIPFSTMIVSAQFWPPFKEEKLQLHEKLKTQVAEYTRAYETLKASRTLCFKTHLGVVDLEIEVGDRVLNLSVSPVHATILMHFQDKSCWELEELSKVMNCPLTVLRRKVSFWQCHGIIVETAQDVFALQEDANNKDTSVQNEVFVEDYETESAMASAEDQRECELQTFWSYIIGMLMNLETLPLDRIHQMLKMFAFQGPTIECSLQELKVFLDRKVREHQLIYSNGLYKLPK